MAPVTLITGPARSGKSEWGEALAQQSSGTVIYVATATVNAADEEWRSRIAQHRQRRPAHWATWEVPVDLAAAVRQSTAEDCLLIDSLGTWVANLLAHDNPAWEHIEQDLLSALQQASGQIILVAEETGWGVVPAYPLGRQFRDRLGYLTRRVGAIANPVYLVTAGYALNLRHLGSPIQKPPEAEPSP